MDVEDSPDSASQRTAPGRVIDRLCADILSGHLPAGSRLVVAALAKRYGTSPMPIRAALQELGTPGPDKAKKILLKLSDPTEEPVAKAGAKSASGAWAGF